MAMKVTAGEFHHHLGYYQDVAATEPVIVTRHGQPQSVLISAVAFEALLRERSANRATPETENVLKVIAATEEISYKLDPAEMVRKPPREGNKSKISAAQKNEMIEAVLSGRKTGAEMARLLKVSPATVSRIVSRARAK